MKFHYEARGADGRPVFGMEEADSVEVLQERLRQRRLEYIRSEPAEYVSPGAPDLSVRRRLQRLGIGGMMQAALHSHLPLPEAMQALAREPGSTTGSDLVLGLCVLLAAVQAALAAAIVFLPAARDSLFPVAGLPALLLAAIVLLKRYRADRSRRALLQAAQQFRQGTPDLAGLAAGLSRTGREILESRLTDEQKTLVLADLLLMTSRQRQVRYRLLISFVGPLLILAAGLAVIHTLLLWAVADFQYLYNTFGVTLPVLTQVAFAVTDRLRLNGPTGSILLTGCLLLTAVGLYGTVVHGWFSRWTCRIPGPGTLLGWTTLADIARRLAIGLRRSVEPAEALRLSVCTVAPKELRDEALRQADRLETGKSLSTAHTVLQGLPLFMLEGIQGAADESRRRTAAAATLDSQAAMLETASFRTGMVMLSVMEVCLITVLAMVGGLIVLAVFLPAIELINYLA